MSPIICSLWCRGTVANKILLASLPSYGGNLTSSWCTRLDLGKVLITTSSCRRRCGLALPNEPESPR